MENNKFSNIIFSNLICIPSPFTLSNSNIFAAACVPNGQSLELRLSSETVQVRQSHFITGLTALLSETSSSRGACPPPPSPATSRSGWRTRPGPSWTPPSSPASLSASAGAAWWGAGPATTSAWSARSLAVPGLL